MRLCRLFTTSLIIVMFSILLNGIYFFKKNLYIVLFERSNKLIFQDDGIEKRNENLVNPANDIEKRNI